MFQGEKWDDASHDESLDSLGDVYQDEHSRNLHPAILAAVIMGCITGGFALITWFLTVFTAFLRARRRISDLEANKHPRPSFAQPNHRPYSVTTTTTTASDGSSEWDTEDSQPSSTRVARRQEPSSNADTTAAKGQHDCLGLPTTLFHTPVVLLGPLAVILTCLSMICRCTRSPKLCQEQTGPFVESGASTARQRDTLPTTMHRGNGLSNESAPLTSVATCAEPSTHRVDFTPAVLSMHASLWICIGVVGLCTIANSCSTCVSRGVCFCWPKSDNHRCQSLYKTDNSAHQHVGHSVPQTAYMDQND
ncbi:hypothetical protein CGRA01v4_13798 [Colletotrichum graminicola]|nr:hypothetical protein CGRA01v4_13798 [Colletotrichum graminicola]